MSTYSPFEEISKAVQKRTADSLMRLRRQLDDEMPQKSADNTLVLGTWNIRNFDDNRFGLGPRMQEDLVYIAEIISRFDVLAVCEICTDLGPLNQVLQILDRNYEYILTYIVEGGNSERIGFIFDTSKVTFGHIAGELMLPQRLQNARGGERLFSRTPFVCSFQSGRFEFFFSMIDINHRRLSSDQWIPDIKAVGRFLASQAKRENHILVGNFSVMKGGQVFDALAKSDFEIIRNNVGSNDDQSTFYSQISFWPRENEMRFAPGERNKGVLQFFKSIYRDDDVIAYKSELNAMVAARIDTRKQEIEVLQNHMKRSKSKKLKLHNQKSIQKKIEAIADQKRIFLNDNKLDAIYREWRTYHCSDHFPLWVELEIDFDSR